MKAPHITPLTGLRGLAAWWVVLHHYRETLTPLGAPWLQRFAERGFLAVDLFFVLSGFVIHLNYGTLFQSIRWDSVRYFGLARFARIYPLYIFTTLLFLINPLVILLFSHSQDVGPRYDPAYFLLSLFLAQNWGFTREIAWNGAAWSISTEFVGYIVFPILSCLIVTRLSGTTRLLTGLALALVATALFFRAMGAATLGTDIAHLGLVRCLLEFAAGMLMAELYCRRGPPGIGLQTTLTALALAGAMLVFVCGVADFYVLPTVFAVLIFALTRVRGWAGALLGGSAMLFLGDISYAVYLIHSFVKDWVNFLLVRPGVPALILPFVYVAAVAAFATVLHRFVELPARAALLSWSQARWTRPEPSFSRSAT